nr:MAG TPA: tail protein [Caudoviricetes sp.]
MKTYNEIDIKYYDNDGNIQVRCSVPVTQDALVHYELMQSHYCKLSFKLSKPIYFLLGDFIDTPYGRFELIDLAKAKDNDTIGYSYEIQFDAYYRKFKNKILKYRPNTGSQEATFSLTSTISTHVEVIMKSLAYYAKLDKSYLYDSKFDGEGTDYTYVIDASVDANAAKLITYSNSSMLDAIANIAQTFGCEWWFEGNILHFGTCENTNAITDFRLNDNIVSMSSSQSQSTYANRVYAFGAARNLPSGYRNDADADITKDGVVEKRLMLPNSAECSDKNKQLLAENGFELKNGYIQVSGLREDQYVEGVTTNDDIYPRNLIKTSKVTSYEKDVEDESTPEEGDFIKRTFYRVNSLSIINEDGEKTGDMAFRKSYILSGKNLHIVFQSGSLNGMDFECEFNPDGVEEILKDDDGNPILKDGKEQINPMSQVFEIVANEDYGRFLPDITLHPKDGDTFVLYNWDSTKLGDTLVSSASNELLTDAIKDLKKSMIDPTTYTCTAEANYSYNQGRGNLHGVGDRVNLYNKGYGDSHRSSRVIGYEFCLDIPYDGAKYYVGEKPSYSRLNAMESKIEELVYNGQSYLNGNGGGGKSIYIIKSYDKTAPTDYNVYSAKAIDEQRLNRTKDDTAHGTITFEKVQKFLQGLNISEGNGTWSADGTLSLFKLLTNNFDSGLYGHGAQIDEKGDMEVNSIYARKFISAPKFVFNEISVTKAEQWNTNGYGTIESVDVKNRTITLHLEENDYGSLQVGDICRGLYADIDNAHGADKTEEGALDDCNFVQHKGFFSTYFYVMHIITNEKGKFVFQYGKKSSVTPDPCAYMDFAQYGSFTDDKRQSSMYFSSRGNSFIEVLDGVNTWEVQSQNRVARYGWLGGLALVKKDGSIVRPEGNGIYVQDNIYFGGNINYLQGLSGLDDLREEAKAYDVSLSQYQSVITVDDMGNVINGLYTEDEAKTTKQYRISTAVFVRKGMDILLEEDGNTEDVTAGHYRVHAVSEDCEVMVQNSTIFVTAIRNVKDGVAGTNDDANFNYDAMRKATDAMVTIVVELEGKTSKMVQMPIRIQHDTLPFMVCDLSNESASVAWNTKTAKYIGLPIKTKVSLMYHNEPWAISSLNISKVAGLKTSMSIEGKAEVITIDADNLTDDTLAQVTKMNITVVGRYAGANYEYTRELTILKSSDTVVYELIPSADSIVVDKDGGTSVNFVSCDVYATSSDDKRYKLTALPSGMSLKYGKSENATKDLALGAGVDVTSDDKMVTFALYDSNNNILDKESVPVLAYGKDGKGIEYIFKLQNSGPSNPTPSDYATNAEYQRTDKEFVPSGWTDDPTGVDAVNQYEWVSKRVSTNGHWGPFSDPAEYAHYGKHAPKAKSSDDIVTIPTDSNGNALLAFSEEVGFSLLVDGHECNISSIQRYSSTLSNVSCSISGNVATITCEEGAVLGITSQTIVFKVTGTLDDGSSYSDYVTVKVVPNVTGSDGDGYEYIYYLSSSSLASSIPTPSRKNGSLTIDWQDDPMPPTVDKQYVYVAYKKGTVGSDGTFSTPKLFNRYPKSIAKQETKFYAYSSLTSAPKIDVLWNSGSTSMPTDFNDSNPWLWKIIRTTYTDGTTDDVVSCEGYKAKDGIGITSVNTWYGLSKSMTSQPSSFTYNTLSKVVIETHANDYVWSADKVTYTNNNEAFTGIYCIGKCSDLASVTEEYGTSLSADSKPSDNSWSGKYPENAPKGTYIWSRDKITWKDGTITTSDAQLIGYIATDGKHAPKASSTDDIVTIPTDSNGKALAAFSEDIHFSLRVDGRDCNVSQVVRDRANTTNVSYYISGNTASISCAEGARLGMVAQTIVFKVTGTLDDGSSYSDYVTVKIVPNVMGADGDGYEYIYYQSNYLHNNFSAPNRTNGKLTDGWQDDLMAPTVDKRYVFVAYKRGELGSDGEFSMPQLFNRYPRSIVSQETKFIAWDSLTHGPDANYIWDNGSTTMPTNFSDAKPWLWKVVRTNYTEDAPEYTVSCEGYKAKDGHSLLVGYQSSASEPSVLPTSKTLADYDNAQDNIGNGWAKTAPATGGKSIVLGGKITTGEIVDRYNSSTNAWGTEESEILLDGIKQKKTFYKTPASLGNNGYCIRRIKVVNHFRDSYLRVMMKSYSEANYDMVCISRLYLPSEVIDDKGNQLKTDDEYLSKSKYAYEVSGDGQSLVAELSMPDAGEYYFFIGYFKDGSNDSYGDYGLFAWQAMIALTESLWRTDGTVDDASSITWSKAMPMQAEAIVMERAYIATANDTSVPAKPYRTNGILQGGWTAKRLAVSSTNRFIWESVRTGKHGTDSVQDDWSQPVVVANFAEAGKMGKNGCIVRNSEGWKSGATYHNDSALTKEQKYIDLIYIEDNNANDGWSIYQCNVTHTATGSSFDPSAVDSDKNKLWTKLSDAGPMYSPLIVAKNAVLKFAQGQQFNLMEGNNIFGSFRWVKDDADYAFWIGGTEGSEANTSITRGGKLTANDAVIKGTITATSGKIGGLGITEKGLSVGILGQSDQWNGTLLERSSFWSGYLNNAYGEVCVGKAAVINPFTKHQQTACDMYGYRSLNVKNATMIVRKITKGSNMGSTSSAINSVEDPFYAALHVDTDEGIGIRSIGGNLLGSIAQNVFRTDSVTQKEQTAIDNNRVGIIVMTNSRTVDVKLPKNPMTGQMLIVVQGNSNINFDPVVSDRKVYCSGDIFTSSKKFQSNRVGQFTIFIWDGYVWQMHYIDA